MIKILKYFGLLAILPLLTVGLTTSYADHTLDCPDSDVTVERVNNPNLICLNAVTADRWVGLGIATIVGHDETSESTDDAMEEVTEEAMTEEKAMTEAHAKMKEEKSKEKPQTELTSAKAIRNYVTGTITSVQDPGMGHESHQLAILLPPSENIYTGQLTFSASERVQYVSLHGPLAEGEDNGQPIWTPDGITKYAMVFVDQGATAGGWFFSGNALALHTMMDTPFSATYSISYLELPPGNYREGVVAGGTVQSIIDPGIGHESHSLAIILPPSEDPYHSGILSYSASEPIQLVALHGPLAIDDERGQAIWSPDGETKYALTFVNVEDTMGTWAFTGNALAAHTMNPDGFTISYSVATRN